jgi:hypothetical protein
LISVNPGKNESTLTDKDELLHRPTADSKWRESYYFNWVDLENKVSGFSTIGVMPNENKREFVLALFVDSQMEVHYQEPELDRYTKDINAMLQDGKLAYKLIRPFKMWQINYNSGKLKFELTFKTRFPTYNFATDSSGSWHHHFEASGIISGRIEYANGTTKNIRGYGQRDKSWGQRDWHKFDHWFAGQFQFKNWTCAFRKDYVRNRIDLSGYIASREGSCRLTKMEIETINDTDRLSTPLSSTYVFSDPNGNGHVVESERIEKNSYFRFARTFPEGYTELFEQMVMMKDRDTGEIGSGMAEYLRTHRN